MKAPLSPKLIRNFGALMTLQVGNYLIPLLLVPYLLRTLGIELFGIWMFALAFVIFARVCVSYGFDLTATRQAALAGADAEQLSQLLANVIAVRLAIWTICLVVLIICTLLVSAMEEVQTLILIAMVILVGEAIFPVWLFQGRETMSTITQFRLGGKLANLFLTVLLVRSPDDLLLVPLLEALTSLMAGALAFWFAMRRFGLRLRRPAMRSALLQVREGGSIFAATMAVQLYTTLNTILLGFLFGPASVSAYVVAEKIYSAFRGLLSPFIQAVFPGMACLRENDYQNFAQTYQSSLPKIFVFLTIIGGILFVAAPQLVMLVAGSTEFDAVEALRIFALAFPFALSSFLAPILVIQQAGMMLMSITLTSGMIGLIITPLLALNFSVSGAAAAFLIVQLFNLVALFIANNRLFKISLKQNNANG